MAGTAQGTGGHAQLGGGHDIGDVADIGGTAAGGLGNLGRVGRNGGVQRVVDLILHLVGGIELLDGFDEGGILLRVVLADELAGQLVIGLVPFRRAELGERLVQDAAEGDVVVAVGIAVAQVRGHGGAGHQRGAAGTVGHAGEQFLRLIGAGCAHHVFDAGVVLHDIRRASAAIQVCVVNARSGQHVLAQIVDAHVHQLAGIQCAAAQMRRAAGMRGRAEELIFQFDAGNGIRPADAVVIARMPGEHGVDAVKVAVAGQEGLRAAGFLGGTAVIDHGARLAGGLQILLDRQCGSDGCGAQCGMSAAVAVAALFHGLLLRQAGLLAQHRQCVIFAQKADDGMSLAEGRLEGGGQTAQAFLYAETFRGEDIALQARRLELLMADFGVFPYLCVDLAGQVLLFRNRSADQFLDIHDFHPPYAKNKRNRAYCAECSHIYPLLYHFWRVCQ